MKVTEITCTLGYTSRYYSYSCISSSQLLSEVGIIVPFQRRENESLGRLSFTYSYTAGKKHNWNIIPDLSCPTYPQLMLVPLLPGVSWEGKEDQEAAVHTHLSLQQLCSLCAVRWRQSCNHKGFPCLTLLLFLVSVAWFFSIIPSCEVLLPYPLARAKGRETSLNAPLGGSLLRSSTSFLSSGLYLFVIPPTQKPCELHFRLLWTPKREGTEWVSDAPRVTQLKGLCGRSTPWWPSRAEGD